LTKPSEDEQGFAGDWTKTATEDKRGLAHGSLKKLFEEAHWFAGDLIPTL
jgi:hypothetical protein